MSYEINFGPWGSIFAVPTAVADRYLKFCTEEQLKVLLLALRQGQGPVDTAGIAARLRIGRRPRLPPGPAAWERRSRRSTLQPSDGAPRCTQRAGLRPQITFIFISAASAYATSAGSYQLHSK